MVDCICGSKKGGFHVNSNNKNHLKSTKTATANGLDSVVSGGDTNTTTTTTTTINGNNNSKLNSVPPQMILNDDSDNDNYDIEEEEKRKKKERKKLEKQLKNRSKEIDKELKRSAKIYQAKIKLLLLGSGESGKSTVVKQMRIIHTSNFDDKERCKIIGDIKSNIKDTILSILNAMERLQINLIDDKLKNAREYILENVPEIDFKFNDTFWDYVEQLWKDNGVKECALRGNEYHLMDSAQYFMDRVNIIRKSNYIPNDQDILRCRVLTRGILETEFKVKHVRFHIFDVGGQREERRKWVQCFNEVTAVIFVVDISAYNMTLREDSQVNRLRESLDLFRSIWVNRWLSRVSVILFLNKYDILVQKITSGQCILKDYFPEFETYKPSNGLLKNFKIDNEDPEVTRAKLFILELFIDITHEDFEEAIEKIREKTETTTTTNNNNNTNNETTITTTTTTTTTECKNSGGNTNSSMSNPVINTNQSKNYDIFYEYNDFFTYQTNFKKFCIPYFTCAVDTENIKRVFKACNNILQKEHLEKTGLI